MDVLRQSNDEQAALWNGVNGQSWVEAQEVLDCMFLPIEQLLVEVARSKPRAHVLDVGCGTGATTLAIQKQLAADARCTGLDISAPMLDHARARAERDGSPASFVCADAEQYAFEPQSFDLIVSRFGVMFFGDSRRAFQNLRRATRENADLFLIAWRSAAENPFMTAAERAVATILPNLPPRDPDAPGQFYFADSARVQRILEESGWSEIELRPLDVECTFATADLLQYLARFGPLGRFLQQADEPTRARVLDVVRPAFDPYVHGPTVRFEAACWKIAATNTRSAK